ncbi:MAG TPA: hypothetical protein VN798_05845, partial [Pseudomonas sp.]|nr:hypothetical protein [Pseudomonas sp.]
TIWILETHLRYAPTVCREAGLDQSGLEAVPQRDLLKCKFPYFRIGSRGHLRHYVADATS